MVTSTTQVSKRQEFVRRIGISEQTIVSVTPKEYPIFSSDSAFNCNDVYEIPMADLIRKIEENGSMNYPEVPDKILAKIVAGVHASPSVSQAIKNLL